MFDLTLAKRATLVLIASSLGLSAGPAAMAQDASTPVGDAELKARAWDAQQAAADAERAAKEAREQALEAQKELEAARAEAEAMAEAAAAEAAAAEAAAAEAAASAPTPAVVITPAPMPQPEAGPRSAPVAAGAAEEGASKSEVDQLRDEVREARDAAKNAEAQARLARQELEQYAEAQRQRYARRGLFIAGGVGYAPNLFETTLDEGNGRSAFGSLGYRIDERVELAVRFEGMQGIDLSGQGYTGDAEGWTSTLNVRVFMLTGKIQPYVGFGIGAGQIDVNLVETATGDPFRYQETSATFRPSAGLDLYISESVAITGDAAVHLLAGNNSSLNWATLSVGLKYRF